MSYVKENYTKFFNENEPENPEEVIRDEMSVVEDVVEETVLDEVVENLVAGVEVNEEPLEDPESVYGVVVNCKKLNVREAPDSSAEVVCILELLSEVEVDFDESTEEFYKVYLPSGIEGFCMRKFIVIRE